MVNLERSEAALMFGSLKKFFTSVVGDASLQKFEDCQLATAALLTRVATIDIEMSGAR